jgi:hypothetical protein
MVGHHQFCHRLLRPATVQKTKANLEPLGKADSERTRYYPQSQLHIKQAPGITFSKPPFTFYGSSNLSQFLKDSAPSLSEIISKKIS